MTDTSSQPTEENATNEQATIKVDQNGQSEECQIDTTEAKPSDGHAIVTGEKREFEEKKIFIGDIDSVTTSDDLKEYFGKYGEITNVDVKNSGKKNKIIRFGFISFTEHSAVEEILKTLPHKVKDKDVTVKQALIKPALKKICIFNLDKNIKEDKIRSYFEKYGKVETIQLPYGDADYITLTFENEAMANEAAKENKHTIESSECTVQKQENVKKPKSKRRLKHYIHPYDRMGRSDYGRGYGRGGNFGRFPNFGGSPNFGRGGPRNPSGYNHFPNNYPSPRFGGQGYGNRSFGSGPNFGPSRSNYGGGPSNYGGGPGNYGGRPYNDGPSNYGPQGYDDSGYDQQGYRSGYNDGPSNYGNGGGPNYGSRSGGGYGGNYDRGADFGSRPNYGNSRPGGYGDKSRMGSYNQEPSSYGKSRPARGGMAFHPYDY